MNTSQPFLLEPAENRSKQASSVEQYLRQSTLKGNIDMNAMIKSFGNFIRSFAKEEEGAQVIEYALIIAVVSIALVLALQALTANGGGFATFIGRVTTCLTTAACV